MHNFEELDNPYFRIDIDLSELNTLHWRGRARIVRKDTGAVVAGDTEITEHSREQLLESLYADVRARMAALARPDDWQEGGVTALVHRYIDFSNRLSEHYMDLESRRKDHVLSQEILRNTVETLKQEIAHMAVEVCKAVNRCSEEEQLKLVVSPEECYENVGNPWYLDDLYARDALYHYIFEPGAAVTEAHEQHHNRMNTQLKVSSSFSGALH